ncbi:hypothetical protein J7384_15785 [Endozoicomonas sp. G2_1]|uniref:hypothetical protein n=1 Tax=Endozoicomonas sp. G2_1 TaxID=2821091 RepID=UPI001ADB3D19|nr:hypothetical protein [Endozoicomonas sp. G2_1]MBO9491821.1 hypothetical protein [Endozoicomonas sp. G2_1]
MNDIALKICIAIVSAGVAYLFTSRRSLKQNVFELNKIFHSEKLFESRGKAASLLQSNTDKNIVQLANEDDFFHLSSVLHFFSNIQNLKDGGLVDKKLTKCFFSRYFKYFDNYINTLFLDDGSNEIQEWLPMKQELNKLRDWL